MISQRSIVANDLALTECFQSHLRKLKLDEFPCRSNKNTFTRQVTKSHCLPFSLSLHISLPTAQLFIYICFVVVSVVTFKSADESPYAGFTHANIQIIVCSYLNT